MNVLADHPTLASLLQPGKENSHGIAMKVAAECVQALDLLELQTLKPNNNRIWNLTQLRDLLSQACPFLNI